MQKGLKSILNVWDTSFKTAEFKKSLRKGFIKGMLLKNDNGKYRHYDGVIAHGSLNANSVSSDAMDIKHFKQFARELKFDDILNTSIDVVTESSENNARSADVSTNQASDITTNDLQNELIDELADEVPCENDEHDSVATNASIME